MYPSVVDDFEARAEGEERARALRHVRASYVRLELGASRLARVIRALPAVNAVAATFPHARLALVGHETGCELLSNSLKEDGYRSEKAPNSRIDLLIDLKPGKPPEPLWEPLGEPPRLTVPSCPFPWREQPLVAHWVDGARSAGLIVSDVAPTLRLAQSATRHARELARRLGGWASSPLVALLPGRQRRGHWGARRLSLVLRELHRRFGAVGVAFAGPAFDHCQRLPAGTPPSVAAALLRICCVCVGDDTGWAHVAAAVGAPVVTVHGASCPTRCGPVSPRGAAVWTSCRSRSKHALSHRAPDRCLACLEPSKVADVAERLAAQRWPWDRVQRVLP